MGTQLYQQHWLQAWLSFIGLLLYLCQRSFGNSHTGLFPGSLFFQINPCVGYTVPITPALEEVFRSSGMISSALFFLNIARVILSLHMCILKVLLEFSTNKQEKITSWDLDRNYLTLTCPSQGSWHLLHDLVS